MKSIVALAFGAAFMFAAIAPVSLGNASDQVVGNQEQATVGKKKCKSGYKLNETTNKCVRTSRGSH